MSKVHNEIPSPNASLIRQQPDDKLKQQTMSSENNTQEDLSLKDVPRDNFRDLMITRIHPNYSSQNATSQEDAIDASNGRLNIDYQNIGVKDPRDLLMNF